MLWSVRSPQTFMTSRSDRPHRVGSVFAAPPSIEFFVAEPDWTQWGDMNSGDAYQPYYFHFALGEVRRDHAR